MRTCWFIVIKSRDAWWVDREGRAFGPIESLDEAIQYARRIAETQRDPGRRSQIWVPGLEGRPVLFWQEPEPRRVA